LRSAAFFQHRALLHFSEGAWAPFDFQTNCLLHLLGFIGLTDGEGERVEGTVFGPDAAKAAIANTETAIKALLAKAA
jgi:FMN-dependent NADH-azoreductase